MIVTSAERLDSPSFIRQLDAQKMEILLQNYSRQFREGLAIGRAFSSDKTYLNGVSHILFSGMGGSAMGAEVVRAYLLDRSGIPMSIHRSYGLPAFANQSTLLILVSYSGDTEETISAFEEGRKRGLRMWVVTAGGELAKRAEQIQIPVMRIPGGLPPRMAVGYLSIAMLSLFEVLGLQGSLPTEEFEETVQLFDRLWRDEYGCDVPTQNNPAKQLAERLHERYPICYGAGPFDSVALRWRGQIEENAKTLASHHAISEMNHHELAGWQHPEKLLSHFIVLTLRDSIEHPQIRRRMVLMHEIISKQTEVIEVFSKGKSLLARMFSLIYLGDWVSFYLAILNRENPTDIQVLQEFKSKLSKPQTT